MLEYSEARLYIHSSNVRRNLCPGKQRLISVTYVCIPLMLQLTFLFCTDGQNITYIS